MASDSTARPYRGVDAADRLARRRRQLLEAGLQLLGSEPDASELTVRAVCRQAGLTARYFYESFTDKDDLVAAVFDWAIADIAATTQAAVAAAPADEQSRAGMANVVRAIAADARVGRLLFGVELSNAVIVRNARNPPRCSRRCYFNMPGLSGHPTTTPPELLHILL